MKKQFPHAIILVFLFIVMYAQTNQSVIFLHHADISSSRYQNGEVIRALSGNVYVTIDTVDFYCDSALYFPATDVANFYGNVKIVRGTQTIYADFIRYYRNIRKAVATGEVRLIEPGHLIQANKIIYFTNTKNSEGFANVVMNDSLNMIYSVCDHYQYFPSQDSLILMKNVIVHSIDKNKNDTTTIFCDTLHYISKKEDEKTFAFGNVRVLKGQMISQSKFAAFYISGDSIQLEGKPNVKIDNNTIRAKTIRMKLSDGKISFIALRTNAEMVSVLDSVTMKEDVLKARDIDLFFEDDSLRYIVAKKNAIGKYNVMEEGTEGLNYVTADTIKIFVKQNKADSLFVIGGVEGTFFPEKYRNLAP
jgi:lipopolysaccharide export system protein LptA